MHRAQTSIAFFIVALLALLTTGCASNVTVPAWQRSVDAYVAGPGRDDPNVLRDVTLPNSERRGFAMIGHHNPHKSTDANGLLLAHRDVGSRPWFIYLVGLVRHEKMKEMRLAAMTDTGKSQAWRVGPRNKDAERAYREYNLKQFRERFPDRRKPPAEYLGFPRASDTFDLTDDGQGHVVATHKPSGARWEVNLSAPKR